MITKATLNLLIDFLAFLFSIGMLLTGFILWWPLPPGTNKDRQLWTMSRHEWGEIHIWVSYALILILAVHLLMHWKWILGMFRKHFPSKQISDRQWAIVILAALTIFLSVFFAAAMLQVKKIPDNCALNFIENLFVGSASAQQEGSKATQLFSDKCISCHGVEKTAGGVDLKNKSSLTSADSAWVVKFSSSDSRLISLLENLPSDMKRRDRHVLTTEEIQYIKDWIDAGAD